MEIKDKEQRELLKEYGNAEVIALIVKKGNEIITLAIKKPQKKTFLNSAPANMRGLCSSSPKQNKSSSCLEK